MALGIHALHCRRLSCDVVVIGCGGRVYGLFLFSVSVISVAVVELIW